MTLFIKLLKEVDNARLREAVLGVISLKHSVVA